MFGLLMFQSAYQTPTQEENKVECLFELYMKHRMSHVVGEPWQANSGKTYLY